MKKIAILAWSLPLLAAWGQSPGIDVFTTEDGLIHNQVTALFQQPSGYLWIGTGDGVCRFNGREFDHLQRFLPGPEGAVAEITGDQQGRIWILAAGRLWLFDENGFHHKFGDNNNEVRVFKVDRRGRLWVVSSTGFFVIDQAGTTRPFTREDGLPDISANCIFEDRSGLVWAGFRLGSAARYEEETGRWTIFGDRAGMGLEAVTQILQTKDGRLWFAGHGGLFSTQGDGTFLPAPFIEELPSPIVYSMFEDSRGNLWTTGPNAGVGRWDGSVFRVFSTKDGLIYDNIKAVNEDNAGRYWFTSRKGISILDEAGFHSLAQDQGLSIDNVATLLIGSESLVWIGTSFGLNRYEAPLFETFITDFNRQAPPTWSRSRNILRDEQGGLWFPSYVGLGHFDGANFKLYTQADGLPDNEIHVFLIDHNHRIWVGCKVGGAYFDGSRFQPFTNADLASRTLIDLQEDSLNRIWVTTTGGEFFLGEQPSAGELPEFRSAGRLDSILNTRVRDDKLIAWTTNMVFETDGSTGFKPNLSLAAVPWNEIVEVFSDRNGNIWCGGNDGVYRTQEGKLIHESKLGGEKEFAVTNYWEGSEDSVWVSLAEFGRASFGRTEHAGLARFHNGIYQVWNKDKGLLSNRTVTMKVDQKGHEWVFSDRGLSLFDGIGFRHWAIADGLVGNLPRDLIAIEDADLWVATNGGLNKMSGDLMVGFTVRDGLLDRDILDIERDANGALWVRTRYGVQRLRQYANPPAVELISLTQEGQPLPLISGLILSHRQNSLAFGVSGLHLRRGADQMQYEYKLIGKSNQWSDIIGEPIIRLPGLSPDEYEIQVRAYNRELAVSNQPASFRFVIKPPFWQRTGFILGSILIALLISYAIYRHMHLKKMEEARVFNELMNAQRIQMSLMPKSAPIIAPYDICGTCVPAREVGGDYFDFFWLDNQNSQLGLAILDVSGKSMEAAMIAVMSSGLVHGEIGRQQGPAEILTKINYPMYRKTDRKIFTTGIIGCLDKNRASLTWANAGHMEPIIIRDGRRLALPRVDRRDLPLGAVPNWQYQELSQNLLLGDVVVLYTDGLSEGTNERGELLGEERMIALIERAHTQTANAIMEQLLAEVKQFSGSVPQHDDITIIVIKAAI